MIAEEANGQQTENKNQNKELRMANKKRKNGEGTVRLRKDGRWEGRIVVGHTGEATCTEKAVCEACGISYGNIDENAHAWDEGVITKQPTCTEKGVKTYTCTHNSAHTYTEDVAIDENAHTWNEGVITTNPTCSAVGTKTFTCTHNSEHTKTEDVAIDENAHAWDEGVITKQLTCTEKGVKTYTCTHNSAHTRTEDVSVIAHSNNAYGYCKVCQVKITGAQVSLGDDLSIKYYVKVTDTALLDLGTLTMQFTMNEKTETVTIYETVDGEYVFTLDGIAPQQMTDLIDVVVFAGDTAITSHDDYSIKQNCVNLLAKSADDLGLSAEKYAAMKVLIADLLSYGKAAQDYKDYTEGGYATDDVDGLTPSEAVPSESDKMVMTGNTDSTLCFESATVRFDTVNYLYIKINATAEEESKVTVKVNETEYALSELVALGNGIYKISTEGLSAVQFDDILTVELSYNGTVYATLNYSVNAYTYAMNNGETENEEMKALALALYRYGKSAEAYANAQ